MSPNYIELERKILRLFLVGNKFIFQGINYEVLISGKPQVTGGEPKTDVYIKAKNIDDDIEEIEFKLSIKQANADFLENKISTARANAIFGDEVNVISQSIASIQQNIITRKLIYKAQNGKTLQGSICLGWRLDIMNKLSGNLSGELILTNQQKCEILTGEKLPLKKKNASINGRIIANSGVANYMIDNINANNFTNSDQIAQFFKIIDNNHVSNLTMFFALKALNYRSFENRWDGNRPLAVSIDWSIDINHQLKPNIIFDNPLSIKGNVMAQNLKQALRIIRVENTNELNINNVYNYSQIVYEG
jgi:hypothetical protein